MKHNTSIHIYNWSKRTLVNNSNGKYQYEKPLPPDPKSTGIQGEELACRFLQGKGYHILDRNFRHDRYELDIVARDGSTVVFCEVKTARTGKFGPATSWVTPEKTKRIARAAEDYIAVKELSGIEFRFDVIGIEVVDNDRLINHIENAFMAPEGA